MTNQMISCPDCATQISPNAETCPSCGRVNDWVHPGLERIIERLSDLPGETEWQARGHELLLVCRYQTMRQKIGMWLFKSSAVLLVGGLFANWIMGLALTALIIGGATTMFGYDAMRIAELHIDLRALGVVRQCSDRRFWQAVIRQAQAATTDADRGSQRPLLPGAQRA